MLKATYNPIGLCHPGQGVSTLQQLTDLNEIKVGPHFFLSCVKGFNQSYKSANCELCLAICTETLNQHTPDYHECKVFR